MVSWSSSERDIRGKCDGAAETCGTARGGSVVNRPCLLYSHRHVLPGRDGPGRNEREGLAERGWPSL